MFEHLESIPPDPLLGLIAAHRNDPRPNKIDLGVGVFKDDRGHTRLLDCVKQAEARLYDVEDTKTYLGPPGVTGFNQAITDLLYGADSWASNPEKDGRLKYFNTAKVIEFEQAGHWLHHDQFDKFMLVLRDFL